MCNASHTELLKGECVLRSNLKEFRLKLGFSQEEIGKLFGLNRQMYHCIENGERQGSAKFWLLLQKKFNLSNKETLDLMEVIPNERT